MSLPSNFWSKTERSNCILWTGALNSRGYGCFGVEGKSQLAHRVAYEDVHGPIPDGMTVDHLCRVTRCVNVDHMEIVTIAENNRRAREARGFRIGGECSAGHALIGENVIRSARGRLICRECQRGYVRERRLREGGPGSGAEIREWARANRLPVSDRGTLPLSVRQAYYDAHRESA